MCNRRLILSLLLTLPAMGQASGLSGTWTLAVVPDLARAIEEVVAPLNFLVRPIARARLAKTSTPYQALRIALDPTTISIQADQNAAQHMPADGQPVVWTREDGEKFIISAHPVGDDLVQTFKAKDGERTNRYHLDQATHTLDLSVTIASPRLPRPLAFTLVYR
jgi:hypothetical protein